MDTRSLGGIGPESNKLKRSRLYSSALRLGGCQNKGMEAMAFLPLLKRLTAQTPKSLSQTKILCSTQSNFYLYLDRNRITQPWIEGTVQDQFFPHLATNIAIALNLSDDEIGFEWKGRNFKALDHQSDIEIALPG